MTPARVLDALAAYLKEACSAYFLTDGKVKDNPLIVSPGFLKKRTAAGEMPYPHIVPRFLKCVDESDGSKVTVRIYFGAYSEDVETGWRDLMNFMEMGRLALLRQRTIAKKYRLQLPLTSEATEDQPYPEWGGYITAEYLMPLPEEEKIIGNDLGGNGSDKKV